MRLEGDLSPAANQGAAAAGGALLGWAHCRLGCDTGGDQTRMAVLGRAQRPRWAGWQSMNAAQATRWRSRLLQTLAQVIKARLHRRSGPRDLRGVHCLAGARIWGHGARQGRRARLTGIQDPNVTAPGHKSARARKGRTALHSRAGLWPTAATPITPASDPDRLASRQPRSLPVAAMDEEQDPQGAQQGLADPPVQQGEPAEAPQDAEAQAAIRWAPPPPPLPPQVLGASLRLPGLLLVSRRGFPWTACTYRKKHKSLPPHPAAGTVARGSTAARTTAAASSSSRRAGERCIGMNAKGLLGSGVQAK